MTNGTHALVLGADGFIGRRLCTHLLRKGWSVDRGVQFFEAPPSDAEAPNDRERTLLMGPFADNIENALAESEPDVVFNLAAAGVGVKVPYADLIDGNAGLVARLMQHIDPGTTTRVIHAGSWSQYHLGDPNRDITEDEPMDPPTVYGAAKVGAELVGRTASAEVGVPFITLRLFNVYGPGENSARLIPYVVDAVSTGSVSNLTSGEQIRDFVFVDDVAAAFEVCGALANPVSRSFNVATGTGTRVRDVAIEAAQVAGGEHRFLRFGAKPQREDEPPRVVGDARALTEATGWKPQVAVAEGIERTIRSILNNGTDHDRSDSDFDRHPRL